ncbi:putative peptidase M41, AAA+ ATPase domain, ATPase, AAA-type, core [Dioscorea sansibarensis]
MDSALRSPFFSSSIILFNLSHHRPALLSKSRRFSSHTIVSTSRTPPNPKLQLLDLARKPLAILIFSAAVSFSPFVAGQLPAIAAPIETSTIEDELEIKNGDHEFSGYTRRLLAVVPDLLRRINELNSGNGDMNLVREALKMVKKKRREIQGEVLEKLNAEVREWKREKAEVIKKSGEVLDMGFAARKERDRILKEDEMDGGTGAAKEKVEKLEEMMSVAEDEYNLLWEKVGEIEDRILKKETMTYSVAIRELSFIERECDILVDRCKIQLKDGNLAAQPRSYSGRLSKYDIQKELENAQKEYWEQLLLPTVLEAEDSEIFANDTYHSFALNVKRIFEESRRMQRNLEAHFRQKLKKFGDEKRFLVHRPEEVLKGFPEIELKWMFGAKEVVVPKAASLHLFHGWKKWREEAKANLKKDLLENDEHYKQYIANRQERILLDRERVMTRTWYNDERNRWEIDPVAVPYVISKKLIESARIRHDWAVMYIALKGDDKEYLVDIKELDLLFEDFGGFDGLYTKMLACGIPTTVQVMWIPLSELDIHQQFLLASRLSYQCLNGIWKLGIMSYIRGWGFSKIKNITDDLMVTIGFPLIELFIPKPVRLSLGMVWPEEVDQAVGSTWFLKWQSEAEMNYKARKRETIRWYLWFLIRSMIYGFVIFNVLRYLTRKVPRLLGYGPWRKDPNLWKLRRLKTYRQFQFNRRIRRKKEGIDPIRSAFDQMKRVKSPPIRLSDFASVDSMKEEINDIVTCLQNPTAFQEKGARAPRGVLIVGERGTGKTSLALAIAAEAKVPVVEIKAQQLEAGLWVGQSASNVRELFQTARDLAPVIIFVEDFDQFAGVRGQYIHTKKQDHEAFINQLLVELDGFENQTGVVLMATTRNLKQIDEALQRPGRMDRVLHLQRPTQLEREKILQIAARDTMDEELIDFVDWKKVAEKTALLRPVELKLVPLALEGSAFRSKFLDTDELMCYCGWFASLSNSIPRWLRRTKPLKMISKCLVSHLGLTLTSEDLQSVVDLMEPYGQISNGIELLSPPLDWTREKKFPHAVWAAGRGLIALLLPNYDHVDNLWLEPLSWEGIGCTKITKAKNEGSVNGNLESRSYLEKKLVFCFGSYVAAQLLLPFGEENFLSSSELKQAQEIATRMVIQYGWGPDDSPAVYIANNAFGKLSMGKDHELEMAAKVEKIYSLGYDKAKEMLEKNRHVLETIVERLLEFENLTGEDLLTIFKEYGGTREEDPFFLSQPFHKELSSSSILNEDPRASVVSLLGAGA